ncbi:MAG TPA: protein kinase [Vicinamibacterales bacterium]|nr:protein kinase [Vicinamibacterales bacterium]
MSLSPGTRLGPYEILSGLGAGGMGEVYKARDVRLDRLVAIKVLPADQLTDPESKRRFIREARAASALNHPNIVTIYDVGSENGVEFLAMELIEGRTLDELTPRHGFRVPEMLRYAEQAADALAKAHAAGIVHRDLKPGNVMVTGDGLVKVLDFGIAKLVGSSTGQPANVAHSTATASEAGLIVGTASFMSPEQAEGKPVDARSDIFSFGAVLYEMATGQRAFTGDTPMSTISAILRDEPKPLSDFRREIPAELERVIRRCLRKDPARRFQTMADLKVALGELKEESDSGTLAGVPRATAQPARSNMRTLVLVLGGVVLVAGAVARWFVTRKTVPTAVAIERPAPLTSYPGDESYPSFSPDGSQVVFSWDGEKQDNYDLYVKVVGPGAPLRLTTDPGVDFSPAWSPDGRTIAFARSNAEEIQIMLIPALGGPERTLARFTRNRSYRMLSWAPDGKWLVVAGRRGDDSSKLHAISIESGEVRPLTNPSPSVEDVDPAVAPDGKVIAFERVSGMNIAEIWVLNVSGTLEPQGEPRKLPVEGSFARQPAWTADGREILYAAGIDLRSNLYRTPADGSGPSHLIQALGDGVDGPSLSYSSRRLAYSRYLRNSNIWRLDLRARTLEPGLLISSTLRQASPQYSPDGKRIVFYSNRSGLNQIWVCDADGTRTAQLTSMTGNITGTPRWSPDGKQISFDSNTSGDWQIYVMDADGGKPKPLTNDKLNSFVPSWSRDGRWVYFARGSTGNEQIWKIPSQGGTAVQITRHGGSAATESVDGKTLFVVQPGAADSVVNKIAGTGSSLWRMPVDGGAEVMVVPSIYRYNFAVTATGIYYDTPTLPDKPSSIEYLDFATGKVTTLHTLTKPVDLGLAVSPDGRYLLFAQSDFYGSDLMLVENFK